MTRRVKPQRQKLTQLDIWPELLVAHRACAAAPAAVRGGAAQARSAEASYVPVTRKVILTDEKKQTKSES